MCACRMSAFCCEGSSDGLWSWCALVSVPAGGASMAYVGRNVKRRKMTTNMIVWKGFSSERSLCHICAPRVGGVILLMLDLVDWSLVLRVLGMVSGFFSLDWSSVLQSSGVSVCSWV